MSTFANISSETTRPIEAKFHMEPPWDGGTKVCSNGGGTKVCSNGGGTKVCSNGGGTKVCSNGPGHMTKIVAMPIYGKNLKKIFFFGTKRPMTLKLGRQHRVVEYYQVCSNDDPGLTMTYFTTRSSLVPYAFVWEKGKTMDFSEPIVVCDLKLATDDRSDKKFLLTSTLCPLRAVCPPAPGLYTCIKS